MVITGLAPTGPVAMGFRMRWSRRIAVVAAPLEVLPGPSSAFSSEKQADGALELEWVSVRPSKVARGSTASLD